MKFKIGQKVKIKSKTAPGFKASVKWIKYNYEDCIGVVTGYEREIVVVNPVNSIVDLGGNYFLESDLRALYDPRKEIFI